MFQRTLHVDAAKAEALVAGGFTSLDEVAYVPFAEFQESVAFDEATITDLRRVARTYLLTEALDRPDQPPKDLLGDEPPEVY
jgi:N utilization substance protein A